MNRNVCKNCLAPLLGKYCASCGQKVYTDKDKSVKYLFEETFHFLTHFEGKFFTTFKSIYRSPGTLTLNYTNGIRQRYYKPISFYLLIVIAYLLFPLISGMNMEMKYYKSTPFFGHYITSQIDDKLLNEEISEQQLSNKFHEKSKNTSKFLLLLLIPLTIPILYLLYFKRRYPLFDHLILATEINIVFLLTFFIIFPLLNLPFYYLFNFSLNDDFFTPFTIVVFILYSTVIFYNVFGERWWLSFIKGLLFSFIFMFMIITIYRTIVFQVTFAVL